VTEAKYMINLAILVGAWAGRPHPDRQEPLRFGLFPNDGGWTPRVLHPQVSRTQPMGSYNCLDLVDTRTWEARACSTCWMDFTRQLTTRET
jgi:hypothetical protein